MAESIEDLQLLNKIYKTEQRVDLNIIVNKTTFMVICFNRGMTPHCTTLTTKDIERVASFQYPVNAVTENLDSDIKCRIDA